MGISEYNWAQYGKAMMLISGLSCLALALHPEQDALGFFLRVWVGLFGLVNVGVALKGLRS